MKVIVSHHIDCSDRDENGMYEYYYECDIYEFVEGNVSYIVRAYMDEPGDAHFLKTKGDGDQDWRIMMEPDKDEPLFKEVVEHLKNIGKPNIRCFMGRTGYIDL
ncbi:MULTISPECIES: hypothetical protein [unclassified Paraburkholderia]|uniref:hypothetical protein n=1 Tax=unclassified Paraburkholderia TaxID=2615204 RepID=UPI001610595C|nr:MULTISPECIES: hypothetical protein [unclassified Paraburkholderia]MBB5408287.1 hypothetical protein [Paraburkholderia sp. HC6.4b]MBB5455811.1 hypothetical protein [Paraburkholderia sp. Kb1A]